MRLFAMPSPLLCLLAVASSISLIEAAIIPSEGQVPKQEDRVIAKRQCANQCGFYGQVCCGPNEVCITDANNQAQCGPAGAQVTVAATTAAGQGNWQYYTTTQCRYSLGESPCGSICCSSGQYCMTDINQCAAAGGGSSAYFSSFYTVTQVASVPVRPTSNTVLTVTSTGVATATVPFSTPVGTDGSTIIGAQPTTQGQRLSGGAIAGIVIGVIAGIIILFLICVCCCARGAIDGIRGIFGGGRRRRTETTYIEERRSRHGSRPAGRTWFGARPARVDRTEKSKKTGGGLGGLATVTAGLGAMALFLGLKRRRDQRIDAKSSSSYSYYDESYTGTSESSLSSDRRTRDSRRSRR
ncbi:hypothetical protein GJ744_000381 [Endocarpon pusillum]|uniref:Mid2 domain-containing protein n=1 Tax=Endocarpon pusillum TaxID=364733 RepID=A0A8H7AET5_9EURO|nr:hypothetical protein GJ744_000381 [Endocarpon pusillum]